MTKRYRCGNCGEVLPKKERTCQDCEVSIEEFKKPYHKLTPRMKILYFISILCMTLFLGTMIFIIILIWFYDIFVQASMVVFIAGIFGGVTFIQIRKYKKEGYKRCNKCNRRQALHTKYCIYCGNKIKLILGP